LKFHKYWKFEELKQWVRKGFYYRKMLVWQPHVAANLLPTVYVAYWLMWTRGINGIL